MVVYQEYSKRKISGGRFIFPKKKRLCNIGSRPALTKVDEKIMKTRRKIGGKIKYFLLSANKVNVINPKTKKAKLTEIIAVLENQANRHFVRRNIITKGAVVETSLGKVKITSKPGQEGTVNGVLLSS